MANVWAGGQSNRAGRVMEDMVQRLLAHPYAFPYAIMVFCLVVSVVRHHAEPRKLFEILLLTGAQASWLPIWVGRRNEDPAGRTFTTIGLAFFGSALSGSLLALETSYTLVALALMAQYFTRISVPLAVLCGVLPALGSEYSQRAEVLADPHTFLWGVAIFRALALGAIGVSFRLLQRQVEERSRLQESLAAAERKAGQLEERQRLAREIHDTLAQGFAGVIVHLETAEQTASLEGSPAKSHMDMARSVAREGLEEARRMLAALRPEILEQRGLPEALGRVCRDWSGRTGVSATLSVTGVAAPMHPEIELAILRSVQEALTNVARHAQARTAAVTLSYMEDLLVLDVQDDGKGFVPGPAGGNSFGLAGMRERAKGLSGTFSLESVPGEGTTISIALPVLHPTNSSQDIKVTGA